MTAALVTGGAAGIGAAIVEAMLAAGHEVVCLDLQMPERSHPRLHGRVVDLSDVAATRAVAASVAAEFEVSRVVHNAGAIRPALLTDVDVADLEALGRLHLAAPLLLVQAVLPGMRARRFGRVVLVSSRAVLGLPTRTSYAATKAGMAGLVRTWALELAGDGITVNAVAPGPIAGTEMFHAVVPEGSAREATLAAGVPVGRLGRPEDVARAVGFFLDEAASFVTGQTLFVCGGASVGALGI